MSDYKMFNSLNSNACEEYDNITIGDNGKGTFVGLKKIAIVNMWRLLVLMEATSSSRALGMRTSIWLILVLVRQSYQHACSSNHLWVGYGVQD
jgi:hypothetical protein